MTGNIVLIHREKKTTAQIRSSMFDMCYMLFTKKFKHFELLPHGSYGTWGLYIQCNKLHYYLLITDVTQYRNPERYIYNPKEADGIFYECIRTNYKIEGLKMTPSEGFDGEWYEKCFRNVKDNYDTSENDNDVYEFLRYGGCKKHQQKDPFYQYYKRVQKNTNSYYDTTLSKKECSLIKYIEYEPYYQLSSRKDEGKDVIYYCGEENRNIDEILYNDTISSMFKKAYKKRNNAYSDVVRKINPLNDDCIGRIVQYVF